MTQRTPAQEQHRLQAIQDYWDDYNADYDERAWQRFVEKVSGPDDNGCLVWTAHLQEGYGGFSYRQKIKKAHRWLYKRAVGPIPEDMQLDHLCRNRACVNPDHLEVVTPRTNVLRGEGLAAKAARQTHCIHGHEWTPENTYTPMRPDGRPRQRVCRTCKRQNERARKARLRAEKR